jgi:glycosyltransferase involved in cell wall biosynthesis
LETSTKRALVVSHHADIVGGGEISLLTLLKGLGATRWKPDLVVPQAGTLSEAAEQLGVRCHTIPMATLRRPGASVLRSSREFRGLVRELRPDVLHANGTRAMFYAGVGARATGVPAIWHLRIVDPDPLFDAILVRLANTCIATSEAARQRLSRWPAAMTNTVVVPNGLDLENFRPTTDRSIVRRHLGLVDDDLAVIATGRLVDFKRFDILIDALAHVRNATPGIKCIIVGDGPERSALEQRTDDADLRDVVSFTGHRDDIADLLAAADIFALTSPVESFGRVLIEAMAMRLPTVAVRAGGPAEIVVGGETGELVEPNDASAFAAGLESLARNVERRQDMAEAAHRRVSTLYSLKAHTDQIVSVYEDLSEQAEEH